MTSQGISLLMSWTVLLAQKGSLPVNIWYICKQAEEHRMQPDQYPHVA
jgi:hypothetical protein